jgi:hypothetical protein
LRYGRRMRSLWIAVLLLATACATTSATYSELKTRAAFDLKCDRSNLTVTPLSADVAGVSGCGQQATYVERCERRRCSWVVDNPRSPAAPSH